MKVDERNIAAIHCKAGKGRTGVMICCYLVYTQLFKSAKEALVYYGKIRTSNGKGVTIPSQIRYVYYYDEFLKLRRNQYPQRILIEMPHKVVKIYKIRIISIPSIQSGGFEPLYRVKYPRGENVIYDSKWEESAGGAGKAKFLQDELSYYDFRIKSANLLVHGDVKIEFFHVNQMPPHKREKAFHFWFNTSFIDQSGVLSMDKPMIEKAAKDKKCSKFDQNFRIEVYTSQIVNYRMEEKEFEKGMRLEVPVESFTDDQLRLLEIAEKLPKLSRKLSL